MGQDSGGLPHYTAELANAVSQHADVTVLKATETSAEGLFDPAVEVIEAFESTDISMQNIFELNLNVRKNLTGLYSFKNLRLVNDLDPDIVHDPTDEFPQVSLFAYLHGIYKDRPYVITSHEVEHGGSGDILKLADIVGSAIPDFPKAAAVVHSEKQREALLEQDRNIESVHVIPHGVYTFFSEFDHLEPPEELNHALFFGSLIPPKGLEFLVRALPAIVEEIPDFSVTIAGKGNIPNPDGLLDEYTDHVTIRNEFIPNEEVGELFSRAKVVVLPYRDGWQTGHSGTLSTAFAFGKPVVTTDVGDFQQMVGDAGAGVVVEPESADTLAEGVIRVLSNESQRREMAEASAEIAEELSWENIGEKHIEMYREIFKRS
ncbi:glycosyltransferase [Natronosalvus caseinilyticus]|uniref:glycosyltransferase n=1 Tax=Natronosalvus caseinilyticus TaxID=2953747 RepID=UPI0028AF15E0|nr:glycosyltransferase [Natronosalvus caseinilyticus]